MLLQTETSNSAAQSFFASACLYCPHCAEPMIAPEVSEFVAGQGIRHRWICDACGGETSTYIPFMRR